MKILGMTITFPKLRQAVVQAVPKRLRAVFDFVTGAWQTDTAYTGTQLPEMDAAVFACRRAIAEDVGKMSLGIIGRTVTKWGDLWLPTKHKYAVLLAKPNSYETRTQFIIHWLLMLMDHGNTIVYKQRDRATRTITALHVMPSSLVTTLVDDETGLVFYHLPAWPLAGIPEDVIVPATDIIHDRYLPIIHPLVGTAPLLVAATYASINHKSAQMVLRAVSNNGIPAGVLEVVGDYTEEQLNTIRTRWDALRTAGSTAVVTTGVKFHALTNKATDMQSAELWKMSNSEVHLAFGVPEWRTTQSQVPGNARASESAQLGYYAQTLQPRIENIEALLGDGLGLGEEFGANFDVESLYRLDIKTQVEVVNTAVKASVYAPNDGRVRMGLTPVDGGEEPLGQMQYWPLSKLAQRDPSLLNGPAPKPEAPETVEDTEETVE
jgi:HK97 family phage portal protein